MPSAVAAVHQKLKPSRWPLLRATRARSRTALDASSTAVFTHSSGGLRMAIQSSDVLWRIQKAMLRATKTMPVAASKTNRPMNDARRSAPRPSGPLPSPPPQSTGGGGGPWITPDGREPRITLL